MKVLMLSALYPPHMRGGAENSARNLAEWLQKNGVEVGVARAADREESEGKEVTPSGIQIWRVKTSHIYSTVRLMEASAWQKPLWHLQDHFDQRIRPKLGKIFDEFQPDLVNVHLIQGLGYPILQETASRSIPVNYVLPDLGLCCIRMSMFKNGKDCKNQCIPCKISGEYKRRLVEKQGNISFVSPSASNINTLARFFPVKNYRHAVILNANAYPVPTNTRAESGQLRLLYAGRLHESKGVEMLLEAVKILASRYHLTLTIAGNGQQEEELRSKFGDREWCNFLGFIPQNELANIMNNSDLLCIPSIWAENSPGVVIQALGLGLPVMGSDRGGIPELVRNDVNGRLVKTPTADAWAAAIEELIINPGKLHSWRENAKSSAFEYDQDTIGRKILSWMTRTAHEEHD